MSTSSANCERLPDWHELTAAFSRSWSGSDAHPVLMCACRLGRLHRRRRPRRRTVAARRRRVLIEAIDTWASECLRSGGRSGQIGACVDRMAAAFAAAQQSLRSSEPITGPVHAAFTNAASLIADWTEITAEAAPRSYKGDEQAIRNEHFSIARVGHSGESGTRRDWRSSACWTESRRRSCCRYCTEPDLFCRFTVRTNTTADHTVEPQLAQELHAEHGSCERDAGGRRRRRGGVMTMRRGEIADDSEFVHWVMEAGCP